MHREEVYCEIFDYKSFLSIKISPRPRFHGFYELFFLKKYVNKATVVV